MDVALAAWWIAVLALFFHLRTGNTLPTIDETIPLKISEAMSARGYLDPNWRFADLPGYFRYDQYNFYFYNIVAHVVIKIAAALDGSALSALRGANLLFQSAALALAIDAMRRIGSDRFGLAIAGALIVFAPGMVQDASIARPESLLYLLSALFVWLLTLPLSERWRVALAGMVLGAGAAIKLTFVSMAVVVVLPWVLSLLRAHAVKRVVANAVMLTLGAAIGFAAAAPNAVLHFDVYLHGLARLAEQYRAEHAPHSPAVKGIVAQALWIGRYFMELYGLVPLGGLAASFLLKGAMRVWAIGLLAAWIILVVYFATKSVLFERNFSHALIPLLMAAALGMEWPRRIAWRAVGAALMLAPMIYWAAQISDASKSRERLETFETARGLRATPRASFKSIYDGELPTQCEMIAVDSFNDPWTAAYLAKLAQGGFAPIARFHGRFSPLVTSTLHTYLEADVHYFRCPEPFGSAS